MVAPGHRLQRQAAVRIDRAEQRRIRRRGVEIDQPDPGLLRQRIGERVRRDQPADQQDGAEQRVLPLLLAQRRVELFAGQRPGADQHVPEERPRPRRFGDDGFRTP